MMNSYNVIQGAEIDLPMQAYLRGSGRAAINSIATANDTFTTSVYQGLTTSSLFSPTVTWYTAGSTQLGYPQFQFVVSVTNVQSATYLLAPLTYIVVVQWTPYGSSKLIPVARFKLVAKLPQQA